MRYRAYLGLSMWCAATLRYRFRAYVRRALHVVHSAGIALVVWNPDRLARGDVRAHRSRANAIAARVLAITKEPEPGRLRGSGIGE